LTWGFKVIKKSQFLILLAACVLLGTLVQSEAAFAQRFRAPATGNFRVTVPVPESPRDGYRHFVQGDIVLVFNAALSAYRVSGLPDRYFQGERFIWRHGDKWRISNAIDGPWRSASENEIPRPLLRHYAMKSNDDSSTIPAKQAR
jgi:hypothetical protein